MARKGKRPECPLGCPDVFFMSASDRQSHMDNSHPGSQPNLVPSHAHSRKFYANFLVNDMKASVIGVKKKHR